MRKKKLVTILLIATFSVLCFCACGGNSMDYKKLEELLDNKQYDEAISMIQQYRNEENLAKNKASINKEAKEYVESIVGTYVPNKLSVNISEDDHTYTINGDLTLVCDGQTYPYKIESREPDEYNPAPYVIYFETFSSDGYKSLESLYPYINEAGYAVLSNSGYIKEHAMDDDAKEQLAKYAGKYLPNYPSDERPEVTINDDFTVSIDGQSYPIEYVYSNYEKKILFHVVGYSRYNYSSDTTPSENLAFTTTKNNQVFLWSEYYRPDQLDYVEITADNLYDYFEWTDWYVDADNGISRNAFGEIVEIYFKRNLQLKEEYLPYYFGEACNVAMEFEYINNLTYANSTFQYNLDSGKCVVTMGDTQSMNYRDKTGNFTVSYLDTTYDYVDGERVYDAVYLLKESQYFSVKDDTPFDGSTYTFTTDYSSYRNPEWLSVIRSQTKIAFVKKDLK